MTVTASAKIAIARLNAGSRHLFADVSVGVESPCPRIIFFSAGMSMQTDAKAKQLPAKIALEAAKASIAEARWPWVRCTACMKKVPERIAWLAATINWPGTQIDFSEAM